MYDFSHRWIDGLKTIRDVVELESLNDAVFFESSIVFFYLVHLFNVGLSMCGPDPLIVGCKVTVDAIDRSSRLLGPKVDVSSVDRATSLILLSSSKDVCLLSIDNAWLCDLHLTIDISLNSSNLRKIRL